MDIALLARQLRDVQHDVAFRLAPVLADLQSDIVIPAGISVFLDGSGATVKTLEFQFRVENGARLCMYNLNFIDGTKSAIRVGEFTTLDMAWVTISNMRSPSSGAALVIHRKATVSIFQV